MTACRFTPRAIADLEEIWDTIAAANIDAADRVIDELFEVFEVISRFPNSGVSRRDWTSKPLRFVTVRPYVVAYRPAVEPVEIVTVIHSARDVPRVL